MTYQEKLKDPRWQKMRLQVLERDNWACCKCFDKEATLHVHHTFYKSGADPWEYPTESLITLCEECHEYEGKYRLGLENDLIASLKRIPGVMCDELVDLNMGFAMPVFNHLPAVVMSVIMCLLTKPDFQTEVIDLYFEFLKRRREDETLPGV